MNYPPEDASPSERTVLVADDEAALTDSFAVWLSDDYAVRTAYSGRGAIEAYDPSVDVVLLDRRMPDVSGDRVLEELRDRPGDACVALLTATEPNAPREDADRPAFDAYLAKPISKAEVLAAVERLASRRVRSDAEA